VLVVDDDLDVRSFLDSSLKSLGFETLVTQDGYAGLAALDGSEPDAMIVDFAMPGYERRRGCPGRKAKASGYPDHILERLF